MEKPHEEKRDILKDLSHILEIQNLFETSRERIAYLQFYYMQKYTPYDLDIYLDNSGFPKERINVRKLYESAKDISEFVKICYQQAKKRTSTE